MVVDMYIIGPKKDQFKPVFLLFLERLDVDWT